MKTIGERIKERMHALGITQAELAKRAGISQPAIYKLISGKSAKTRYITEIAQALRVTPEWLATGERNYEQTEDIDTALLLQEEHNVYAGPETRGLVPLISWVSAGTWHQAEDQYQPGDAEQFLPCPATHGPHTYALRVTGDSMTAPYGRSYPDGIIIYVDPDQRGGVVSGDRVIAKVNGDDKVTFKIFIQDGGQRFLKPLNPAYPIITDKFRILGKIIGAYMEE